MIKLQSDFLGHFFVEDGNVIRPMQPNTLKLNGDLVSQRVDGGAYRVTDANDEQQTWHMTMTEIVYLEAQRFLKQPDFERFVCIGCGPVVAKFGRDVYPRVTELFPDGYDAGLPHVKSHESLVKVIEKSYYRRLSKNHFKKANALRDGDKSMYGLSTDVMTRKDH